MGEEDTASHDALMADATENSADFNRSIIESIGDCVQVLDVEGRLRYMNRVGQGLMQIDDISPYLGIPYGEFCEGRESDDARAALAEAQRGRRGRFTGFAPTADGTPRWWDVVITPIFGSDQQVRQLLVISRDITEQKQAAETLAKSEHLLREAQNYAHIGNWSLEADGVTSYWSEEIYRVMGLDPTSLPGPVTLAKVAHPEDFTKVRDSLDAALQEGLEHKVEYRVVRPDGEIRWAACKGAPLYDSNGRVVRLLGIFQDITERRLAEERTRASLREKEVLLREIHHRVKNNLQVISSLLSLQARQTASKEASAVLEDSCRRIQLMAEIHNRLYRSSDLAQIAFDGFLRSLAEDVIAAHQREQDQIHLDADLEPLTLDIDTAIPVSQIASELVSNAVKHAFPGRRTGNIRLRLWRSDGKLNLHVQDDGTGMREGQVPGSGNTLGLKVVQALVEQLDGDIAFDGKPGASIHIRF